MAWQAHRAARPGMTHRFAALVLVVLAAFAWTTSAQAAICHVNAAASGANTGTSWTDALTDLQAALTDANCTEIWVAQGVYRPVEPVDPAHVTKNERDASFVVFPDVAVYGGFAGHETRRDDRAPLTNPTILSGDIDENDINVDGNFISETVADLRGDNSYHVVRIGDPAGGAVLAGTVLDGFVITGGSADGLNDGVLLLRWLGGGLLCADFTSEGECSPTLGQLVFSGNQASSGGALFVALGNPVLNHVAFTGNTASLGGGAYLGKTSAVMTDVHFTDNHASKGGAVYVTDASLAVSNGVFSDNRCTSSGGAIHADAGTLPGYTANDTRLITLTKTSFINNGCGGGSSGGGIWSEVQKTATIVLDLDGVTFRDNNGAIFNRAANAGHLVATIINSTFQRNISTMPAVFNQAWDATTTTTLNHVTFEGNSGAVSNHVASGAGGAVVNLGNAIIWNEPQTVWTDTSGGAISNLADSIIAGGCPSGSSCNNVIDSNPLLGPLQDNGGPTWTMRPLAVSPAIGAGSLAACTATDQRGVPRPQGAGCDIGAVEIEQPTALMATVIGPGSLSATPDSPPLKLSGGINGCTAAGGANCQGTYAQHVEMTLTANAGVNAHLDAWEDDCVADSSNPRMARLTLDSDSTCTARFASGEFAVSAVANTGGNVHPALQWKNAGDAALITVTADTGYHLTAVTGDACTPADNGDGTWTAANIQADCQVTASFAIEAYTVTATAPGGHGSISPASQTVNHGDEASFTLTADTGYHVGAVTGDTCTPADNGDGTWTAADIQADCQVTASFAVDTYTVTATAPGGHGAISPASQTVNHGDDASFTLTADIGYHVGAVTGDTCSPADNGDGTWTAANIQADCQVTASFAATSYHVGGTVIGLTGSGLVLQNNGGDDLAITANGTFQFPGTLMHGAGYAVSVRVQPDQPLQNCTVFQGTGSIEAADVSDVHVVCTNRYRVGGTVTGLTGGQAVILRLNGGSDLVLLGNGQFSFSASLPEGAAYLVTVSGQPQGQSCSVARASGTIAGADIVDVEVACEALVAQLAVTLDDGGRDYARYGRTLTYVVTLANHGTGTADNVAISATFSAAIDVTRVFWQCITPPGSGTACGAQGHGGFSDNARVAPGRSLTWLVDVPILANSDEATATVTIEAAGAGTETDSNILVLLRDGFDASHGDGTQRIDGSAATAVLQGDAVATVEVPNADIDGRRTLLYLRSADHAVELHWLQRGSASWVRMQASDARGVQQTTPWVPAPGGRLLGLGTLPGEVQGRRLLLLEGAPGPLVLLLDLAAGTD